MTTDLLRYRVGYPLTAVSKVYMKVYKTEVKLNSLTWAQRFLSKIGVTDRAED